MSRLARLFILVGTGLTLPFTASALNNDMTIDSNLRAFQAGAADVFSLDVPPPGLEPPACELEGADGAGEDVDAKPTACCWVFYFGRYWCVPC